MSPPVRRLFTDLPRLEGKWAEARQGLATADDFRFVRAFWEVNPSRIARSRERDPSGRRWCPFAKGGEYSPYWSDVHLVVDYEHDGERLREFSGLRHSGTQQYYFRPGLTWSRRTNSAMAVRVLPAGCILATKVLRSLPRDPLLHLWLA